MPQARFPAVLLLAAATLAAQAPPAPLPGVGAWTEYRGDPLNSGVSHSPRPAYRGPKWKYFAGSPLTSTPAVAAGKVIAPSEGGFVNAIDARTGAKVWIAQCGPGTPGNGIVFTSPLIHEGRVYVGSKPGTLHCLDLETGVEIFKVDLAKEAIYASPKGGAKGIVVSSMDGVIHCLDPATGASRWKVRTHREVGATAAIMGDRVLVPGKDRTFYEIDYASGDVVRRIEMPSTSNATPVIGLGFAHVMMSSGKAAAIDLLTGRIAHDVETTGDDQTTGAFADGILYLPVGQFMRAISGATGELLWEFRAGHKVSPPIVNGDDLLFTSRDRKFRVVERRTGNLHFELEFEDGFVAGPVLVDGVVYVATDVHSGVHVHAIE
jgi:outer membrane protein assembly factor BamB